MATVFPTPVGVFPAEEIEDSGLFSLPHARGGVSSSPASVQDLQWSSPRPWGCFCVHQDGPVLVVVFPTPVGVFLRC